MCVYMYTFLLLHLAAPAAAAATRAYDLRIHTDTHTERAARSYNALALYGKTTAINIKSPMVMKGRVV